MLNHQETTKNQQLPAASGDIEMGPFKESSRDQDKKIVVQNGGVGPLNMGVLGRLSFEEHCDKFLLGSDRSSSNHINDVQLIKKQATES